MGTSISQAVKLNIVDTLPANTPLEPLSENGFVWLLANQVASISNAVNTTMPVWIKMKIAELSALPVYNDQGLVSIETTIDPSGTLVGAYFKSTGPITTIIESAFNSVAFNNNILNIVTIGVLPPAAKSSQDAYLQHAVLAPQIPQVSTNDLLAEIIQRQTNPLDSRKLPDNVTITLGQQTTINNNINCVKKCCHDDRCKKTKHRN